MSLPVVDVTTLADINIAPKWRDHRVGSDRKWGWREAGNTRAKGKDAIGAYLNMAKIYIYF